MSGESLAELSARVFAALRSHDEKWKLHSVNVKHPSRVNLDAVGRVVDEFRRGELSRRPNDSTQKEFARLLGDLYRGARLPSEQLIDELLRACGVPDDEVISIVRYAREVHLACARRRATVGDEVPPVGAPPGDEELLDTVLAVDVRQLPEHRRRREYERFVPPVPGDFQRPAYFEDVFAPPEARAELERHCPLDLVPLVDVAAALDLPPPELDGEIDPTGLRRWFDGLHLQLELQAVGTMPSPTLRTAVNRLSVYLRGPDPQDDHPDLAAIFVLAGTYDNAPRVARAASLFAASGSVPPLVVLLGAPARPGVSLIGEADAAYLALTEDTDLTIDDEQIVIDGRLRSFRDGAGLALGHLLSPRFSGRYPLDVGVVAGPLSSRRAWWLFDAQLRSVRHIVRSIGTYPSESPTTSGMRVHVGPETRSRFVRALVSETEKLLLTRLSGEA